MFNLQRSSHSICSSSFLLPPLWGLEIQDLGCFLDLREQNRKGMKDTHFVAPSPLKKTLFMKPFFFLVEALIPKV